MIIKKATFKGFSEGKTAVRLVFAVDKDDLLDKDIIRIDQLNADTGILSFQKVSKEQTSDSATKEESPTERIKKALYEYWNKCYPGNKTFEMFYNEKMQLYIDQINREVQLISQNDE